MGRFCLTVPGITIRQPENRAERDACFRLRWEVLRAPWRQPPGSERDTLDATARHYLAIDSQGNILATGRIHTLESGTAQIRYMAVHPCHVRQGLGKRLLAALETDALRHGENHIILHARENSLDFYRHCGYRVITPSHRLFDSIQHYQMEKHLPVSSN